MPSRSTVADTLRWEICSIRPRRKDWPSAPEPDMATLRRGILVTVLFTLFGGPGIVLVVLPWLLTGLRVAHGWNETAGWVLIVVGIFPLLESIMRFVVVGQGTLM